MESSLAKKSSAVVLASGGLDSTTLLGYLLSENWKVLPISFFYGSKHNESEYKALQLICDYFNLGSPLRINLDFINGCFKSDLLSSGGNIPHGHYTDISMRSTVVPSRNMIMLAIASGVAESHGYAHVAIANHSGDHAIYPDCRESFISAMGNAISLSSEGSVKLLAPFTKMMKWDIVKLGNRVGAPLSLSWSCYEGKKVHCGKCGTCVERKEAFVVSGIEDLTIYED